jgi:predicted permease
MWGWGLLESISQDIRYALRGMRSSSAVTAVLVASLALGIGANTAIFSLVYSVMLRALPVAHPEQLVEVLQKYPGEPRGNGYWSRRSYEHYLEYSRAFSALTGTAIDNIARVHVTGTAAGTVVAEYVVANYFPVLGVQPALGRLIGPEHDAARSDGAVVVISWAFWNSWFRRDPGVLGKRILVDAAPVVVIGVAPRAFTGLRANAQTSLWLPAKSNVGLNLLGRLKPGVTLEQARAEMTLLFRFTIEERTADSTDPQVRHLRAELEPARAGLADVRDRVGKPLSVLMAIVGVLLLLACVNVAGLLLARGAGRAREMALRVGLGASPGRLMRQVLTESLLLSAFGTAAGAVVAYSGTTLLLRILDSGRAHERVHLQVRPDANLLLFAAGIAIFTGLLFGLAPALSALRHAPPEVLRQSGRAAETRFHRLFGRALVAAQVALSILLLSSAGLLIAHLASLKSADLGFHRDHILLVTLDPSRSGYRGERLSNTYRELLERLHTLPGVRSASLSAPTPLHGAGASGFLTAEGFRERPEDRRRISISYVAPGYFETLSIPILAGREFGFHDQSKPRLAIINQTLARYYFAGRDPIGKRITLDHVTGSREPATYEIVGVAGNANYREIREAERRAIYLPAFRDGRVTAGTFVIRTDIEPQSIVGEVRRIVHETAAAIPVATVTTLSDQIDASIVPERMMAALSGFFAVLGALLAGIGIYGLLSYTVARRTNEIGIRLALGATSGGVLWMILRETLAIVVAGLMIGAPIALWGRTLVAALIQDLTTDTAASFGLGAIAIIAVALLASYGPARRAAHLDPVESLRHE